MLKVRLTQLIAYKVFGSITIIRIKRDAVAYIWFIYMNFCKPYAPAEHVASNNNKNWNWSNNSWLRFATLIGSEHANNLNGLWLLALGWQQSKIFVENYF